MDFLKDQIMKATNEKEKPPQENHQQQPQQQQQVVDKPQSSSELLSDAKVVADAARSAARHETDRLDKAKVASSAADLLDAASDYGKFDDKAGVGQYVDKAENYLRQYGSSHGSTTNAAAAPSTDGAPPAQAQAPAAAKPSEQGESGGGIGGYMKMAEGFMKKER